MATDGKLTLSGASLTSLEDQVALMGTRGVSIQGIVEPDGAFKRSSISSDLGDAYETTSIDNNGQQKKEQRHLGVIIESAEGDVTVASTSMKTSGDAMIVADQGKITLEAHK
jgi:hypothetical protein